FRDERREAATSLSQPPEGCRELRRSCARSHRKSARKPRLTSRTHGPPPFAGFSLVCEHVLVGHLRLPSCLPLPRQVARLGKSKSAFGDGALRWSGRLRCDAAPRWSPLSTRVRAEPSGANVMGCHARFLRSSRMYAGECQETARLPVKSLTMK